MNTRVFWIGVIGVIILVVGVVLFDYGYTTIQNIIHGARGWDSLERYFSHNPELRLQWDLANIFQPIGLGLLVLGIIMLAYGALKNYLSGAMRKKTALLVLILIITIIPTLIFLGMSVLIIGFILDNSGNVQILWHNDSLEIMGARGRTLSGGFSLFVGLSIASIVFFIALFLLIRGWLIERHKKHRVRESYTV